MRKIIFYTFAVYFLLTGLYIFIAPETFYKNTPGLSAMGPYNFHFIRDISFVFLVSGGALLYGARHMLKPVLICGAAWPFMHALFHTQIWVHRGFPFDTIWLVDTIAVIVPGLLVFGASLLFDINPRPATTR